MRKPSTEPELNTAPQITTVMQSDPVPLLLVDDRPENLLALEAVLAPLGETLVTAPSGMEALRLLLRYECAAVLLDIEMPEMDGFETARMIHAHPRLKNTPILFLTAHEQMRDYASQGYATGAVDFMIKPLQPNALLSKARVFADLFRAKRELRRANHQLLRASQHDPLTGLLNRRGLTDCLTREQARSRRTAAPLSALLLDLDDFKAVNDRFGHARGDRVLQQTSAVLSDTLREMDVVCRLGGDEFFAMLPDTDEEGAIRAAERVLEELRKHDFGTDDTPVRGSASVVTLTDHRIDLEGILESLHDGFKRSKSEGKDCVRSSRRPSSPPQADETEPHVTRSPIYRTDGTLAGVELVLGGGPWAGAGEASAHSRYSPDLELFGLEHVASAAQPNDHCHVDLSPLTLLSAPEHVVEILGDAAGSTWCVDLHDHPFLGQPDRLVHAIATVRAAGIQLALDHIGARRGSLKSLVHFAPDVIKLAAELFDDPADPARRDTVERILKLAASMECEVIALGIHTSEQLALIKELGITLAQGSYLRGIQ